jgi:4-amino-4-deoxy-L-arabinose transferase-like glycosyltransferase
VSLPFALAAFGLGALAWWLNHRGIPWELLSGDAYEYAEMARRLAGGEGFTTGLLYPAELWLGSGPAHPAVKFPPLWPLLLAFPFHLFGASGAVAHATVGALFAGLVAASAALATRLAGRGAGAVAALAVATHPWLLLLSLDAVSEILFALLLVVAFLACVRPVRPLLAGVLCGLAYLTRYNGAILLPALLWLIWRGGGAGSHERGGPRALALCVAGFALTALPWWIRNVLVTGDPVFSLLNLNLYIAPVMTRVGGSLFFQLEPDLASGVAARPWEKALAQTPPLLARLPYAAANLPAFLGVAWACWRRDAFAWAFAFCAAATLGVVALALALGRYFVPLVPLLLVLGTVAWVRHGGRLRLPALAALLLAAWLPSLPPALPDLEVQALRAVHMRRGEFWPKPADPAVGACLEARPLVLAQDAARLVWQHRVVAIYAPVRRSTVSAILDAHPVAAAQLPDARRVPAEGLVPLPECGPGWYAPAPRLRE